MTKLQNELVDRFTSESLDNKGFLLTMYAIKDLGVSCSNSEITKWVHDLTMAISRKMEVSNA